ncbi:hypothetical protein KIN20_015424 [Parelaphostrongylus tenuis]|uniref:Uncharacterized protein n=1 Tax=Parelaphostrongylus tenuis TaxID=148309 RepID=A0AAD5N445_PARTN|nr:hypothetical protein KIN20_015424 [Parelaphostrongylus tenuis]
MSTFMVTPRVSSPSYSTSGSARQKLDGGLNCLLRRSATGTQTDVDKQLESLTLKDGTKKSKR